MKKLLLILSVLAVGLSGCYVEPYRDHDGGYRRDRGESGEHRGDRDDDRGDRHGDHHDYR